MLLGLREFTCRPLIMQRRSKVIVSPGLVPSFPKRLLNAKYGSVHHVDAEGKNLETVPSLDRILTFKLHCSNSVQCESAAQRQ